MVFFVCQGCNESLKKNQVDKHAMKCRDCHAVACVDCQKTFYGNDYAAHTTCMSEAQRYQGALYQEKVRNTVGLPLHNLQRQATKANPQDQWNALIEEAVSSANNAPATIRPYLSKLADFGNVPRNQKKFANFASNSLRIFSKPIVDEIWKFLEALKVKNAAPAASAAPAKVTEPEVAVTAKDTPAEVKKEKKEKKAKKEKRVSDELVVAAEVAAEDTEKKEKKSKKEKKRKAEENNDSTTSEVIDSDSKKKKKKHKRE